MERKWLVAIPILLALLALCAAMTAIAWITVQRIGPPSGLWFGEFGTYDVPVEDDEQESFSVSGPAALTVVNACGKIDVRAVEGTMVNVTVHTRAWGRNEQEALDQLALVRLKATQDGDNLRLELEDAQTICSGRTRRMPEVSFSIEAPIETTVQASSNFGSVTLDGTHGDAELQSDFGDIQVSRLEGALKVETDNGRVTASGVQAGESGIQLKSDFGRIQLEDAEATALDVQAVNGAIEVRQARIAGTATLKSDFGNVSWNGGSGSRLEVSSTNGGVRLADLEIAGNVNASSDFGGVTIEAVSAESYTVNSANGAVVIHDATGDVTARSDFGSVEVSAVGAVRIDLGSESGAVTYTGELGAGENKLRSGFGNIVLRLPEGSSFLADLETGLGKISSEFPITIQGSPDRGHWQGQVGDGGPALKAITESGNITLEYR